MSTPRWPMRPSLALLQLEALRHARKLGCIVQRDQYGDGYLLIHDTTNRRVPISHLVFDIATGFAEIRSEVNYQYARHFA